MTVLSRSKKAASTAKEHKEPLVPACVRLVTSARLFPCQLRWEGVSMFVACWSVKGGSGTTVVSAGLALQLAATGRDVVLVDMAGDLPAALGIHEPDGPGLADWLGAASGVGGDALARLEGGAGPHPTPLPLGGAQGPTRPPLPLGGAMADAPTRAEELAALLAVDARVAVVDCGSSPGAT